MCGINGFNWRDDELIQVMNQKLQRRGPDDDGEFVSPQISLGHRRLSILDLSQQGHQPMSFEHLTIVYNGEVYNFQEIREKLKGKGYSFDSNTDTEVVLKAFHAWGTDALEQFNGMFAFAIWDEKKHELFLARDRMGIKPLYYYYKDGRFVFSSEIKSILAHANVDATIIPERLTFVYKTACLPGELTMFKHIHQLPAGHYAKFVDKNLVINKYWDIEDFSDTTDSVDALQSQIRELLTDSVKKRLIADVPVGVFLSGGIDSSVIALLAQQASAQPIKTFSIGFEINKELDKQYNSDFYLAKKTAEFLGTDHHEVFLKRDEVVKYFDVLGENLEMPNSMTVSVPSYFLSQEVQKHVKVVLGGDGGDELFGGYERYQLSLLLSRWYALPQPLRQLVPVNLIDKVMGRNLATRLRLEKKYDRYASLKFYPDNLAASVFNPEVYQPGLVDNFYQEKYFKSDLPTKDFEKYFMYTDTRTWLVDHSLIRADKVTMNFGLEQRVPILDHRLTELAMRIPSRLKIDHQETKKILKNTFKKDLPDFLFDQPKRGWIAPAAKWLKTDLRDQAHEILSEGYNSGAPVVFDHKKAQQALDDHISGKQYNLQLLWTLITYQLWYRNIKS